MDSISEWKSFQKRRDTHEGFAIRRFSKGLREQIQYVIENIGEPAQTLTNIPYLVSKRPLELAYQDVYARVGADFATRSFNRLKSTGTFLTKQTTNEWIEYLRTKVITDAHIQKRIRGVTEVTSDRIKRELQIGVSEGLSVEQIARNIQSGNAVNIIRARVIARTEIVSASNLGNHEGAISTNLDLRKLWIVTPDGRERDTHREVSIASEKKPLKMDEYFEVGEGKGQYPGDPELPPEEAINCRCVIVHESADGGGVERFVDNDTGKIGADGLPKTNDIKEIEKLIQDINPNIETKIPAKADPEILKEHYRVIAWIDKNTNGIKTKFHYEYGIKKSSAKGGWLGYFDPNPVNSMGKRSGSGDFIPQNIKMISYKDKQSFKDVLDRSTKSGWFAKGTTVESIMAHEMAHYIDIIGGLKKAGFVGVNRSGRNVLLRDNRARIPNSFQREGFEPFIARRRSSESIMNEMYKSFGINSDLQNDPVLAGQIRSQMGKLRYNQIAEIGKYASENPSEYIAMAVQYEYLYPGKNKVAKKITELVFKRYKEAFL
jgi:hypothetical protein